MSTTKHKAPPWRVSSMQGEYLYVEADQGKNWNNPTICHLYQDVTPDDSVTMGDWLQSFENSTANAHLIAAAPELLAALEELLQFVDNVPTDYQLDRRPFNANLTGRQAAEVAEKAINKAKGIIA